MSYSPPFDVAGPGALYALAALSLISLVAINTIITVIETLALFLLKWGTFWRCLLAAFVMNTLTTFIGVLILAFLSVFQFWSILVGFVLSVLIEGVVLLLFKRGAARENWRAALVANLASYILVILPAYFLAFR